MVLEIRRRYRPWKVTLGMLAKEYGVTREQIKNIVYRRHWTHI